MKKAQAQALLNVSSQTTDAEIKKAYKRLSLKHHPDKGGQTDYFQKIHQAYTVLSKSYEENSTANRVQPSFMHCKVWDVASFCYVPVEHFLVKNNLKILYEVLLTPFMSIENDILKLVKSPQRPGLLKEFFNNFCNFSGKIQVQGRLSRMYFFDINEFKTKEEKAALLLVLVHRDVMNSPCAIFHPQETGKPYQLNILTKLSVYLRSPYKFVKGHYIRKHRCEVLYEKNT